MKKSDFEEAKSGANVDPVFQGYINIVEEENGEVYMALYEICKKHGVPVTFPEEWKQTLREYCYRKNVPYPFTAEDSGFGVP